MDERRKQNHISNEQVSREMRGRWVGGGERGEVERGGGVVSVDGGLESSVE